MSGNCETMVESLGFSDVGGMRTEIIVLDRLLLWVIEDYSMQGFPI